MYESEIPFLIKSDSFDRIQSLIGFKQEDMNKIEQFYFDGFRLRADGISKTFNMKIPSKKHPGTSIEIEQTLSEEEFNDLMLNDKISSLSKFRYKFVVDRDLSIDIDYFYDGLTRYLGIIEFESLTTEVTIEFIIQKLCTLSLESVFDCLFGTSLKGVTSNFKISKEENKFILYEKLKKEIT